MKITLSLLFLLTLTACGRDEKMEWIEIGQVPSGRFFIEKTASSYPSSPYIGVTVLFDLITPVASSSGKKALSEIQHVLIHCNKNLSSLVSFKEFSGNRGGGKLISSYERELKEAQKDLKNIDNEVIRAIADRSCKDLGKI